MQLASPAVWLILIARSRAIEHLRRTGREVTGSLAATRGPGATDSGRTDLEHEDSARIARQALSRLPVEQREAICLAFYRGLTHQQIAANQNAPLGTIKTRIRLGMARLRELLEQEQKVART